MTLVNIGADVFVPHMTGVTASLAFSSMLINAAGEKAAFVFRIRKGGTIDHVGFMVNAASNPQDLRVSLQDVDTTTGDPDGTQDQFRDVTGIAANTYFTTGLITSDGTDGGVKRTVSPGDLLAIVIEFASTVGNLNIAQDIDNRGDVNFPYRDFFTSSWSPGVARMVGHIEYDDGSYEQGWNFLCADLMSTTVFNSSSTPDERALKFSLPFDCQIAGFWSYSDIDNDCDFVLYNAASTAISTTSVTQQVQQNPTNARPFFHYFDTPHTYNAGDVMRLSMKPGASNSSSYEFESPSAALMAANELGTDAVLSTRALAGAWTDDTDRRPYLGLILSQLDDGAGGGGGGEVAHVF